jgi:hypothetical protein
MNSVCKELCKDARRVESCFGDKFVRGSVRRVRREVRLVMVDECGVPVRLMTIGGMSTSVPDQWLRMAFARGVCLAQINWTVWEWLWSVQYFHSPICIFLMDEYRRRPFV